MSGQDVAVVVDPSVPEEVAWSRRRGAPAAGAHAAGDQLRPRPLERALLSSEAAVAARVEALERYAGHVAEAERAYHAHGQIEELRARLPRYEELVAESGADGFAVPEISRLSEDADRLERALRRSVSSAHEAFRYLDG
ncbi:hypothetical protein [Nonomuraea dietziae]|uniref:hypothetical protein n=1 Tax=Nonomuraea dietziae TaxID=65515 RepID=UPI0033DAA12F